MKIEHGNKEIDSNIVSFGGAKKRSIKKLLQQETISFVLTYFEEGKLGRVDEKYWFVTVTKAGEKDKQKFNAKKDQEVNQKLESGKITQKHSQGKNPKTSSEQIRLMLKVNPSKSISNQVMKKKTSQ